MFEQLWGMSRARRVLVHDGGGLGRRRGRCGEGGARRDHKAARDGVRGCVAFDRGRRQTQSDVEERERRDGPWYSFPFFLRRGRRHETARSSSPPTASASSSPSDHTSYAVLFLSTLPIRAVLEDEGSSILTFSRCLGLSFVKNGGRSTRREGKSEGQDLLHQVPVPPRVPGCRCC